MYSEYNINLYYYNYDYWLSVGVLRETPSVIVYTDLLLFLFSIVPIVEYVSIPLKIPSLVL